MRGQAAGHHGDQRAVAQSHDRGRFRVRAGHLCLPDDFNTLEQPPRLLLGQHRGRAAFDDMLGPAHRVRKINREHLADHEPVEQHANCGEVQFDGRLGRRLLQPLYACRDTS